MIVVYPFYPGDEELALKNAQWISQLGGCKGHQVLMVVDQRCTLSGLIENELGRSFDNVHVFLARAEIDGWPEGANYFFRTASAWLANAQKWPYFLWMEPDAIPLAENWADTIQAEYEGLALPRGKVFMGDRVQVEDIPLHMSGVGIYPNPLHAYAGEAYRAQDVAWDMAAKDQIVPKAFFSKLIEHAWKHPSFSDPSELTTQVRPEAVLFHASKDGSLISLLKSKRAGSIVHTSDRLVTAKTKEGEEPPSPCPPFTCDIFIRTYPKDYPWLKYCLKSIHTFCTGFRKIWVVSPADPDLQISDDWTVLPVKRYDHEWKVMNDESEDGYLAQQITKLYADVISDYQPDYILHVDSDVIFTRPCSPGDFVSMRGDGTAQIIWPYTPYSAIETPWQPITEKFLGEKVDNEFMRRFPIMIPRWLYPRVREFCSKRHGQTIAEYVKSQPPRAFSEFNALGAYCWKFHREMFAWVNTLEHPLPPPFAKQFFSWGGLTAAVKDEIDEILTAVPALAEPAITEASGGEARESDETDKPATSHRALERGSGLNSRGGGQFPAGVKELPSGIWVIEGDTHISKWVEQQDRLDHDQNLLPFILPHVHEGDTVIDAGAFIGDHTIAYLKKVGPMGTVYAIEPNPLAMQCLRHNLDGERNHSSHGNLVTFECALGENQSSSPLSGNNNNFGGAYLGEHMKVADVPVATLDSLNLKPDFIKLDIEGSEVKALRGMEKTIERCHPKLVIEINYEALRRQGDRAGDIFAFLQKHGYTQKILQENCCLTSPMFDILCWTTLNPTHRRPLNPVRYQRPSDRERGRKGLLETPAAPPPVKFSDRKMSKEERFTLGDMHEAICKLTDFAAIDTGHRIRVMRTLSHAGLVPRWPKKKKKNK